MKKWLLLLFIFLLPTQLGKYFFFDFSYISGVRIDYLAPVLFLTDIIALVLIFLYRRKLIEHLREHVFGILIVGILLTVNIAISEVPFLAMYYIFKLIEMYLVFVLFSSVKLQKGVVVQSFIAGSILQLVLVSLQFINKRAIQGVFYYLGERFLTITSPGVAKASFLDEQILRPYGTFSHPNSLAGFYVLLFSFAFVLLNTSKNSMTRYLLLALMVISSSLVLFSFSKTAIITYLVVLIVGTYLFREKKPCTHCVVSRLVVPVILGYFFLQAQADPLSLEKRAWLFGQGWEIIKNNIFLGVGFGNYLYEQARFISPYTYFFVQPVHNIFVLFVMQAGVILSGVFGYISFKYIRKLNRLVFLLPIIVLVITGTMDHYWLTLQQNILLVGVIFGLLVQYSTAHEQ